MMDDMVAKGTAAKKNEEVKFAAFQEWCRKQIDHKGKSIELTAQQIQEYKAAIEGDESTIRKLNSRVGELQKDQAKFEQDAASAEAVRKKEQQDYAKALQDYEATRIAVQGVVAKLKEKTKDLDKDQALDKTSISASVESDWQAPEAAAYKFQSGGIVEQMENLVDTLRQKETEAAKDEAASESHYYDLAQQLGNSEELTKNNLKSKKQALAKTSKHEADTQADLAESKTNKKEDKEYLNELVSMCAKKKKDFDNRQELRSNELDALKKAIEIMSSDAVSGTAERRLPALLQIRRAQHVSLAQRKVIQRNPLQAKIAAFLADSARQTGSRTLLEASQLVAEGQFDTVKKLVADLISKMNDELRQMAEDHGWCQAELAKNGNSRQSKTKLVQTLQHDIDEYTADIAQLTQSIADLKSAVQDLDTAMAEAASERTNSKMENTQTIKEAGDAQTSIQAAIAVLKDFYAKSAQATALTQQTPEEDAPETFDKPYQGMGAEGGGVLSFLEVILSDMQKLEEKTSASEESEAESYDEFSFSSKKDKSVKENDVKMKSVKLTSKESSLQNAQEELNLTKDQLDKAISYYDKLKSKCENIGPSEEEKKRKRQEEIKTLQKALDVISGLSIP